MRFDLGALGALAAEVTGSLVITSVALATLVASASSPPPPHPMPQPERHRLTDKSTSGRCCLSVLLVEPG